MINQNEIIGSPTMPRRVKFLYGPHKGLRGTAVRWFKVDPTYAVVIDGTGEEVMVDSSEVMIVGFPPELGLQVADPDR